MIFAIDPGPTQSGWCVWQDELPHVVASGVQENCELRDRIRALPSGSTLAIERIVGSYGMPAGRELFETAEWIGRFAETVRLLPHVRTELVPRQTVKAELCHSAKAKDSNLWQALLDEIGPVGTKKQPGPLYGVRSHARAALALAYVVSMTKP